MESLTWLLTFAVLLTWFVVGIDLLVRTPAPPRRLPMAGRRVLWGLVWAAALPGGSWGPELWSNTVTDHTDAVEVGPPAETVRSALRTPVAVRGEEIHRDHAGRTLQAQRRLALQLPVTLLVFFGLVYAVRRRDRSLRPGALLLLLPALGTAGGMVACEGVPPSGDLGPRPDRTVVEPRWDTLVHLDLSPQDTLLYSADHVMASERGFWVLDRIGFRVAHFDWEGRLQWYAGRRGGGPGEFLGPRTLDLDAHGRVWVLDLQNHRVTGFDPEGGFAGEVGLRPLDGTLHDFAVSPDGGRIYGMLWSEELNPVSVSATGTVERGPPIAVPDAGGGYGMVLQGLIASHTEGEEWVYGFSLGDGLFRMVEVEAMGPRTLYPEPIPFPGIVEEQAMEGDRLTVSRMLTEPHFAAESVAVADGRILVVFRGRTPEAGRLLDTYDLDSGEYVETLLLPRPGAIGAWADHFVLASNTPVPQVLVLRPAD
jgi:hypothetical protein